MVESAGEVQVGIEADPSGAKKGVKKARHTFQGFVRGLKRLTGTIGITLSVAFAVRKFTNFIKLSVQITREFELQRAALTAIIQGQERFLDLAGQQIPIEQARIQALKEQERLFQQITEGGLRPVLSTSKEFQSIMVSLLPTFRQFGVNLEDSANLMVKMADAATLTGIPLDEMVNQSRQILSSNISNETKLAKIVGLNNEIVNQAKVQGRLGSVLSNAFAVLADNVDIVKTTLEAATVELKNQTELRIDEHFKGARDAVRDMLVEVTTLVKSDAFGKLLGFANDMVEVFSKSVGVISKTARGIDNLHGKVKSLSKIELEAFAFTDTADLARVRRDLISEIAKSRGELAGLVAEFKNVDIVTRTVIDGAADLARGFRALGFDIDPAAIRLDEAKDKSLRALDAFIKLKDALVDVEGALKKVADLPPLLEEEFISQKVAQAALSGNIVEFEKAALAQRNLKKVTEETRIAETQRLDPSVIQFALTNITRTTSALETQIKIQTTLRSLELQREGTTKQIADNIARSEAEAKAFGLRQVQLRLAQDVLARQTDALLSDIPRLAKSLPSVKFAVDDLTKALLKEKATLKDSLALIESKGDLITEQEEAEKKIIKQKLEEFDIGVRLERLAAEKTKESIKQFKSLVGIEQREHEIGRLRETQAPSVALILSLTDKIVSSSKIRIASLQVQNVEIQKQIKLLEQTKREADLGNKQFLEAERLKIKQKFGLSRTQAVGVDKQLLEAANEIERIEQQVAHLSEQRRVEAGREEEITIKLANNSKLRAEQVTKIADKELEILETKEALVIAEKELQAARAGGESQAIEIAKQEQIKASARVEAATVAKEEAVVNADGLVLTRERLILEQGSIRSGGERLANEILINQELLEQEETRRKDIRAKELGKDVGQSFKGTVESAIQEAIDGDFEFRKLGRQFAVDMLQAGLKPFLDQFQTSMAQLFQSLAGQFAGMLGAAVISVVGLLGTMAFSKSSAQGTATGGGLGQAFEQRAEPFRGVIAGRKSIPVAQIRNALSSALMNTNIILRQIANNTSRSAENITVVGEGEGDEVLAATVVG